MVFPVVLLHFREIGGNLGAHYPMLAFGDARYIGPYGDPAAFKAAQNPQFDFDKPTPAV